MSEKEKLLFTMDTDDYGDTSEQDELNENFVDEDLEENEGDGSVADQQENSIQQRDLEQEMAQSCTEDNVVDQKSGEAKKSKRTKQPSAEVRLYGEHFSYNSKKKARCKLKGCKRITTNRCTNPQCGMHLCNVQAMDDYFDAGQRLTPPAKQEVLDHLQPGMQNCFLLYHCMTMPTVLAKPNEI
jgi:hypothetical protein